MAELNRISVGQDLYVNHVNLPRSDKGGPRIKATMWPSGDNTGCVAESGKFVILIHALWAATAFRVRWKYSMAAKLEATITRQTRTRETARRRSRLFTGTGAALASGVSIS
jgi:hypothetical protein